MKLDLSTPLDLKKAETYFDKLKKDGSKIELKKYMENRTLSQNSYLHCCLGYFCLHTGYTISEAKELFAQLLPEIMMYEKNGNTFRKSTSVLNTKEMNTLIDLIREVCNNELGVYVPTSEEYLISKFAIDKELQNVK
jgi:hypothetical protein